MPSVALSPHPSTPCDAICRIEINVRKMTGGLSLEYAVEGEIANLHLADTAEPKHTDGLWQTTCFEAFLQPDPHLPAYYEFNFSPSSAWAIYRFDGYREGMTVVQTVKPPNIIQRRGASRLELDVWLDMNGLPLPIEDGDWCLGLSAVIADKRDKLSYWAVVHPPGKPDFHHGDSFAIKLDSSFL